MLPAAASVLAKVESIGESLINIEKSKKQGWESEEGLSRLQSDKGYGSAKLHPQGITLSSFRYHGRRKRPNDQIFV